MPDTPDQPLNSSIQTTAATWLFRQRFEVVLLLLVLGYLAWAVPGWIREINSSLKDSIKAVSSDAKEASKARDESTERSIEKIVESHDKDRQAFQEAILRRTFIGPVTSTKGLPGQ
jgi:hypothetical protein